MTNQKYKNLTLREFDAAAEKFDDSDPSVYNLCRKDYPDLLEELLKEPVRTYWTVVVVQGQCWSCSVMPAPTNSTLARKDTVLTNFPLFCPKCKEESLIDAEKFIVKEARR